ncbi:IS3 family transposase [Bacillus cereus]|uniref:IS3-like element ISBth167 family transposase n=1 Tax=Bacillus cereus TaxID=1396 RepID=UPI001FF28272|nr:IS3-like element ISBth167 family transposase [Bacillus cereus]UOX95968.1 IS3 family transposase [Bacillus cereus]
MAKFSSKDKIQAVKRYLEGTEGRKTIANSIGVHPRELYQWIKRFEFSGEKAFEKRYTTYPLEYKLDVIHYMNENGTSLRETAAFFNIPSCETLRKWKVAYETEGLDALKSKKKGRLTMAKEKAKLQHLKQNEVFLEGSIEALQAENERLRMENDYFKKVECLSSKEENITDQDKAQLIYELRHKYKVVDLVKVANIARSTYYYWMKQAKRPDKYKKVKELIKEIFSENFGRYGYRRITLELRNRGHALNHKTVRRLMNILGLKCLVRLKKYRSYKGTVGKFAPNILKRNFHASKPNEKWVTDVTEFHLHGKKLYLSPILDLYNGEIIAYNIEHRPAYSLVSKMLNKAFQCLNDKETPILHSDQGWHYQMRQYHQSLKKHNVIQSMSRKGNCLDNAVMENFFGLLKSELLYLKEFESMEQFKQELETYIHYYNHKRIKTKLKGLSPVQYRVQSLVAA